MNVSGLDTRLTEKAVEDVSRGHTFRGCELQMGFSGRVDVSETPVILYIESFNSIYWLMDRFRTHRFFLRIRLIRMLGGDRRFR